MRQGELRTRVSMLSLAGGTCLEQSLQTAVDQKMQLQHIVAHYSPFLRVPVIFVCCPCHLHVLPRHALGPAFAAELATSLPPGPDQLGHVRAETSTPQSTEEKGLVTV